MALALAGLPVAVPTPKLPAALPTASLPVSVPPVSVPPLPVPVPTPSLPVSVPSLPPLPISTPSLPPVLSTPTPPVGGVPQPPPPSPGAGPDPSPSGPPVLHSAPRGFHTQAPHSGGGSGGSGSNSPIGIVLVPSITLPPGPLGVALAVALAALPLLVGICLLLLGRLWGEARRMRSARLRLALAAELDLKPHELAQLSPAGLLKLRDQVAFDDLTGVLRRAAGIASVEREIARARRAHTPLVAAFIDVDGLKRVNDSKGHRAGDKLLRGVADLLSGGLRKQDLVFRYGGDEFVCVLPGISLADAEDKLRDLRRRGQDASLGFSVGLAALRDEDDLVSFLGRADQLLYDSRAQRRETVGSVGPVVPLRPPDRRPTGRRRTRNAT